jgi:hypothetical protein
MNLNLLKLRLRDIKWHTAYQNTIDAGANSAMANQLHGHVSQGQLISRILIAIQGSKNANV